MEFSADTFAVFNAMNEGILIIDTAGAIVFANAAYRRFLRGEMGRDPGEIVGRPLRQLRPGAQLPDVVRSGEAALQAPRKESADIYWVNMYPIRVGGEIVGGISIVTFMEEASAFREKIEGMERRSRQLLRRATKAMSSRYTFDYITARSEKSKACKEFTRRIAGSDAPVLLTSESGAGKEVYAQAIHNASPRAGGVFLALNCATFNPDTLDSELFGYVDGAFPGAKEGGKLGMFEAAEGGTLLLDEISEMKLETQSKLLRTLQEHTIRPVGGLEEIPVNVRILAASNADLEQYIRDGRFRPDLYYRLSTFHVRIPPLRERPEDIPLLARQMLMEISASMKRTITISDEASAQLMRHSWPGNIRELRNVLEFSAYLSRTGVIERGDLPENIEPATRDTSSLYDRVRRFERGEIRRALEFHGSDLAGKRAAAEELGISLASLYSKLKEDESS